MQSKRQSKVRPHAFLISTVRPVVIDLIGIALVVLTLCGTVPFFFLMVTTGTVTAGLQALRDRTRVRRIFHRS